MRERITTANPGVRVNKRDGEPSQIAGYAAVFYRDDDPGTEYRLWDGAVERISPAAFSRALQDNDDTRALFNHDSGVVLGRTSAGTLQLEVDDRGLRYTIDPPNTQAARDVIASIERGDISGSSFAFVVEKSSWRERDDAPDIRTIESVRLLDVGPVTFPAYEASTTGLRADVDSDGAREEYEAWKATATETGFRQRRAAAVAADLSIDSDELIA